MSQLTKDVKFLQKAALLHQGKVLILKRGLSEKTRPGAWDLPGGNAEWPAITEPTAHLHKAEAAREIQEETGITITSEQFTNEALIYFLTFFEPDVQRYSIACGWRVELPENFDPGSITLSNEHTEWAWISLNELDSYDFGEPVGTYIKEIIQQALKGK